MKCPVCENQLQQVTAGEITVDVCKGGCGGVWFDAFELQKIDESQEAAGEDLLNIERNENLTVDFNERIKCPKCEDAIMMRHFASVKHEVEIDECPQCAGFWLDYGELVRIRSLFESEQEQQQATQKFLAEKVGKKLSEMRAQDEAQLQKAQKIARIFRFICPSYWIPGEQEWGAF